MGTRIRTHITPKMRIISFVLAFVMVFVGLPYVGVNAAEGDIHQQGAISSTTTQTSIKSGVNEQTASLSGQTDTDGGKTYTYNGNIKTTTVELFDYFSDSEVGGGGPSQSWDDGYSNPYNTFNLKVSNAQIVSGYTHYNADQTVTINYKPDTSKFTGTFNAGSVMYARLWHEGSSSPMSEPGAKMTWDVDNSQFTCTIAPAAYGFTDAAKPNMIYFTTNGTTKTDDITPTVSGTHVNFEKGNTYTIDQTSTQTADTKIVLYIEKDYEIINSAYIRVYDNAGHENAAAPGVFMNESGSYGVVTYGSNSPKTAKVVYYTIPVSSYSFTPTNFQFYFNNNENWTTNSLTDTGGTFEIGKTYTCYYYATNTINSSASGSGVTVVTTTTSSSGSQAVDVPVTTAANYTDPLYFGAFYMSNNENGYTGTNKPGLSAGKSGGPYNNFYWQSHISLKGNTNNYDGTRGKAALQGLVDPNLTGNSASGELQQGGKILPYFNETWADLNNDVMTYYKNDDTALDKRISFPFYEVTLPVNSATGYVAGESGTDSKAKYYQFNSELNNLYFSKGSGNSGHFVETSWGDHIKGDEQGHGNTTSNGSKKAGFFPFNTNSSQNKNYGFGARFDMDFHLNEDGKIAVYDANDKQQNGAGRVNTRFEFKGDDDLWVFIDGHLVLDLGGVHDATSGYIDFTERKAVANYAITLGDGNSKDTLYYYKDNNNNNTSEVVTPGSIPVQDTFTDSTNTAWAESGGVVQNDFTKLLNGNNTATTYDTNEQHTLTVFYMERGMFDSNLLIRFNFPIEPNFNKLKIREDTDFSGINEGLRELTMQAAENDVFKYTVTNEGTKSADVIDGTAPYPTKVDNTRNGLKLTSTTTPYYGTNTESKTINFNPADTTTEYPMANVSYNWVDGFAANDGMVSDNHVAGITNGDGELFLMFGTSSVKSSAEFEGQLSRYSTMKVTQISGNDKLYKPKTNGNDAITFEESDRVYSDYYSLSTPYIFTKKSKTAGYTGTNVTNGNMNVTNGGTYTVRSDIGSSNVKDADETKEVQMTEYFTNVPNKGGITIKKLLPSGETVVPSDKTTFTIKVRFEDVFGVSGVNANNASEYEAITYSVYDSNGAVAGKTDIPMGSSTMTVSGETKVCGTVTVGVNQWAVIDEIPYNTKYIIDEDEPYYAKPTVTNNNRTVITGTINNSNHLATQNNNNAEVTNFSHTLTIKEVTDFSGVNAGLISYTKTAAENDVFKYTVSNSGTTNSDVVDSGIKTPTYDQYNRVNNGTTVLTKQSLQYDDVYGDEVYGEHSVFLDVRIDNDVPGTYWDKDNAVIAATFQKNDRTNTNFILGENIGDHIYQFSGFSQDATKVGFFRLNPANSPFVTGSDLWPQDDGIWNNTDTIVFTKGALYKLTTFNTKAQLSKTSDRYVISQTIHYDTHNYTPGTTGTTVSNTNYEWKDQYAGRVGEGPYDTIDGMTGTTGNNGEFYLMHGTEVYTKNSVTYTQDKESSAKFYNQFARGSTMTVEQDGTLTSPNGGTPDTLKGNNRGAANTSLATYYTTTKTLEGSYTTQPAVSDTLDENVNSFEFDNTTRNVNQSVKITETFKNTVKTGTLKITKEIDPAETENTTKTNAVFTFKLTLTNVFGVANNNVGRTDYDDITVTKTGVSSYSMSPSTDTTENSGTFTLKAGQTLTIDNIPVDTHYKIEEIGQSVSSGDPVYYVFNKAKKYNTSTTNFEDNNTLEGDISETARSSEWKVYNKRNTGSLTLSKALTDAEYASSTVGNGTEFTFNVTLKEPVGVTFIGNYLTTEIPTGTTPTATDSTTDQKTYTITKTITAGDNPKVKIDGIPFGTEYTVTEVQHSTKPTPVYDAYATGTINSESTVTTQVTNKYRKVTLTKKDSKDTATALNGAKYVLLRLKSSALSGGSLTTAAINAFNAATEGNYITNLESYYDDYSGILTTAPVDSSNGKIVVKDAGMTNGLRAGTYFFVELSPPADYNKNNDSAIYYKNGNSTSSQNKIFTIADNDASNAYTINYYNDRKTGSLKLKKTVSGTAPSDAPADYTFKVKLTKPSDLTDFSNYTIQKDSTSISVTSGTEFSVQVPANGTEVILSKIPYGTTYEVYEDTTGFAYNLKSDHDSTSKLTGTVGETGTNYADPANAEITNTYKTGTLELVKVIENGHTDTSTAFTYHVTLTNSQTGIDLTKYMTQTPTTGTGATIANAAESVTIENINYTAGRIEFDVKIVSGTDVSISGLPYGTDYSVSEDDKEGWSKKPSSAVTDYSGTITSDTADTVTKTATFTNAKTGTLAFDENLIGDWEQQNVYTQDSEFIFTVTLAPASGISIDLSDYASGIKLNGAAAELGNYSEGYTFTVTVKSSDLPSANKITGIPYGTAYSVINTDPTPTNSTMGEGWTRTPTTALSGNINSANPDGQIIVNDSYTVSTPPTPVTASLTITKTDTNGTAITSSPATYYLMKLKAAFTTAYENDPAAISNTFKNAGSVAALSTYGTAYGPKQTDSSGQVVFDTNDSGLTIATGDKFFFFEAQAPYGYAIDNSLTYVDSSGNTHSKILSVTAADTNPTAVYPNPNTTGVSVYKTNEYGEGLENGEFDLYYKQNNTTTPPPTYSYNKPETPPVPEATTKINRNNLTVPDDAAGTSSVTTYTYEYSYPSEPSMPSSTEEDWILPRSDNDYIYFRDYNIGTVNSKDTEAFFYQDYENNQKRYWINTWLNNNEFGQNEEIGYDHRYKIKAQFKKSDDSGFKEYEAWERFVDEYTDTANNVTRKTVVWKIQPPDGYSQVRFCLYDGGQCIRTTQEFSYVLGNIYTKTNRGSGTDNKWDYPVTGEHWSTNWNGTGAGQSDKRMSYSTFYGTNGAATGNAGVNTNHYVYNDTQNATSNQQAPEQTQRYTATEQKIVFQCNSKQVWHNIHIEFFSSDSESARIGQGFPGYMMEPYAFAGNDYRLNGYLTYELTIPKGATHFRINNGVLTGNYAYKTKITALKTETNKNNYGNFFKFPNTPQNGSYNTVDLRQWKKSEITNAGDKYYATYNTAEVESDYDYIYFRLPSGSGWSNHVYAYFYGGGDLRAHNWQRGVYSIWPGVAPVATEYSVSNGGTDTAQHSDHYTYEYTQTLFSETPTNSGNLTGINPESTFQYDGGKVYKFKIPKSERVTYENNGKRVYDKVIFNDGFKKYSANTSTSSNNETGMIGFKAGYIYSPDDTTGKKYYGEATNNYTGRGDYLYINNAANWDNLHVTFYNANGTAILQGGKGYIMQYEGTKDGKKYYRIPIPSGAAKFKINNGKGSGLESTTTGVIYPKQDSVDTSKKDYTTGDMIYTLNTNKSLTRDYPIFNDPTAVPHTSESATLQDSGVDYVTRGDKLYIRNTAEWNGMNIGAVKVKFYDSSNAVIGTTGTYTMIVSETESASVASDNRTNGAGSSTATKWYSIDIPMNAAKFELTAPHATAQQYDIYELINSDGSTDRNYKWTKGDMYYETSGSDALTLLYPTYYQSVDYTATDNYGTGNARGDNLYLVVSDLDKWKNMRVTFYNAGGAAIPNSSGDTAIVPNYIGYKNYSPTNSEAVGYWFKIAIPTGAESFRATGSASNSESGDIYELSQNRTYHFRNDYTPGDMQYRITDTLSGGTYNLSLMYPIFTEEPFYSLNDEVNNSYPTNNITIPTPTSGTNDSPILYETNSDTITYNWTECTADGKLRFDKTNVSSWSTIKAQFYNGTSKVGSNTSMTHESGNIYIIDVPTQTYTKVVISSGDYSTTVDGSDFADKKIVARTPVVQQSSRKYLFWVPNTNANNNQFCWFYDSEDYHISSYVGEKVGPDNNEDYYLRWDNVNNVISSSQLPRIDKNDGSYNSINVRKVKIPPGAVKVKFACGFNTSGDNGVLYETSKIMISTIEAGSGLCANSISVENGHHWGTATTQTFSLSSAGLEDGSTVITCDVYDYTSGSLSSKSATYQPEDRYGMISTLNSSTTPVTSGFNDDGNFIKVVLASSTTITKPYIKFLDSSNNVIGGRAISLTARLNGSTSDATAGVAQPGNGSSDNPYKIRLPKNAKSVELYDDSTKIGNTITLTNDGGATLTVSGTGDSRTVSKTSTTKNSTALQSGVTADERFIFYKGTMTHAYYYGGVDGEFCAWPGVPYSYTYTDGGDKVYAFQIPTTSNSTSKVYPYVIFNDGTNNSGTNMTVAVDYTGKEIYQDSNASGAYGSWSAAPKTVTHTTKTTPTPQGDPADTPPEYTEIHLATIVTGADGKQKYIKWLKPKPGAEDEVDTEYLDHTATDIGKDAGIKEVRVKKLGDYYWVETVAPAGYKVNKDKIEFTLTQADTAAGSYITHIVDEPLPGKALLMKTAKEKVGNTDIGDPLPGAGFNLTTRAVQTTFISVAKKTNKSEYYVIPTDDEEYVALSRSGEYDTDGTVSKTIPDSANPGATTSVTVAKLKEYTELFTDENGYIKIENLVWGDYVLTETNNTPSGYVGSLSKVYFTVGKNNSDITHELSLKDEMNPAYIKLFEHINERRNAWGNPTFTFKIKQTHEYVHTYNNGTWTDTLTEIPDYLQKEILVSLTVNDDGTLNSNILRSEFENWLVESTDEFKDTLREYQGMYHIDSQGRIRVEPGSYEITRMPVSRYEFVTSAYTNQYNNGGTAGSQNENLDSNSKPLEKVTISGLAAGKTIDVHYYDKVGYYDKFSQVDTKVNKFYTLNSNKENTTVKGIRIDDYYVADSGTVSGNTLTISTNDVTKFKAYKIMADGTEQQITGVDLAKLDISYNYESGSKDDEQFDTDFSYSNPTITVNNAPRYHDSVYKLNVSYDNKFTTTFNLVFEKQSTNVTYYTAQIIFKNDSQDKTSANTDTNISYFEEDGNRTHAYEFTFVIADDNGTKTVSDIRHNGASIGTDATAWSSALSTMNSSFNILSGYSYSLNSWVQLAPSSPSLTDYNSIDTYLKGLTPTDGKADSIEFAAHLTSS